MGLVAVSLTGSDVRWPGPDSAIGFLVDDVVERDASERLWARAAFYRFQLGFLRHFGSIVLFTRVRSVEQVSAGRSRIEDGRVVVVALPDYPSIAQLLLNPWRRVGPLWQALDGLHRLDALWLNPGHPVSALALERLPAQRQQLPIVGVMRGNYALDARYRRRGLLGKVGEHTQQALLQWFAVRGRRKGVHYFGVGDATCAALARLGVAAEPLVISVLDGDECDPARAPAPAIPAVDQDGSAVWDVLYVGRLVPEKAVDVLLEAFARLPSTCRLGIVGGGADRARLVAKAAALGCLGRVTFVGEVQWGDELLRQYRAARCLVLPSRTEGVPQVLIEAMALGVPVVATAVGGVPALLRHGELGWLAPADAPDALTAAIEAAWRDDDARSMRLAAARAAVASFTRERQVRTVVDALRAQWAGGVGRQHG